MKSILSAVVLLLSFSASAQYYYKDIIGTKETSEMIRTYRNNKVSKVVLTSFDADNSRSDNFFVEQRFVPTAQTLTTITRSGVEAVPSTLISSIDAAGNVIKTVDSNNVAVSTTQYSYNSAGQLTTVWSTSIDSARSTVQTEEHNWQYQNGRISRMLRVRNGRDTVYVDFKFDEKGNPIEEQETHRGVKSEPVLYYYDDANRLTDIVRYNPRAKRLLPEYMFEYNSAGQVIQRITVPSNSDKYLIWRYQYNGQGLKTKEVIYNKQKELNGKVEYHYSFGS